MKQTRLQQMQEQMRVRFGPEQGAKLAARMEQEYQTLCREHEDLPKAMERHAHNNVFPAAAAFRALLAEGMGRAEAAEQAGGAFLKLMEAPAGAIQKAMKVPGLYHLMPWLWKTLMPKLFSEEAGFRFRFHPVRKGQVKFDMLECPYLQLCQAADCPELAPVFCTTDDVCYGHMHPKLIWNRTKTLARGGDFCDFDLYIPQKK